MSYEKPEIIASDFETKESFSCACPVRSSLPNCCGPN